MCLFSKIFFCLFLLTSFQFAAAQSTLKIAGNVASVSGEPLQGANVVVLGTGIGAATNANGNYVIENLFAGEYTLEVSFVGYRKEVHRNVFVHKDYAATVDFRLQPQIIALEEVVVDASFERGLAGNFQERLTTKQIEKSGAHTVGELLVNVPGVDIIDEAGGSGRKRISIRGSNANQVLVLLDGVRLNDPLTGDVDLGQISLADVSEITVAKGGNSSLYGSGALGGVVNITTKEHLVDEIRVTGELGRFGALGVQPAVSGKVGKLGYFFNFESLRETGDYPYSYQRPGGTIVNESRLNADFSSQNYFGKLAFDLPHHSFKIQSQLYHSSRGQPGLVFAWTPYANAETNRRILIGSYAFRQKSWRIRLHLSQHLNETEFENAPPADALMRYRTVPPYHTRYRILSHRGALESTWQIANKHSLFVQTTLQHDDFNDKDLMTNFAGAVRETENLNFSAALSNEWQLPKPAFLSSFIVQHGVRYDYFSIENSAGGRTDSRLSPHVGLFVARNQGWLWNARVNWGKSFRVPTFADLFFQDFRVRGAADLLPEQSQDFDSGVQVGLPIFGWVELSGAYFHHKIENLIVWELGSFATWQPSNTDALLRGWEFNAGWKAWQDHIHLNISHTILHALDKSGRHTTHNKNLTYRPEHTIKVGLELLFDPIALSYHRRMVGDRFVTPANTVNLPDYAVDDMTILVRQQLSKFKTSLKFSVFNLLDEKYEIVQRAPLPGRYWRTELEIAY